MMGSRRPSSKEPCDEEYRSSRSEGQADGRGGAVAAAGGRSGPGRLGQPRADARSRVQLIQALIPLGLEAVNELLQQEVTTLAGARYQRGGGLPGYARWGVQDGSVYLADQKVAVSVPRVRDMRRDQDR